MVMLVEVCLGELDRGVGRIRVVEEPFRGDARMGDAWEGQWGSTGETRIWGAYLALGDGRHVELFGHYAIFQNVVRNMYLCEGSASCIKTCSRNRNMPSQGMVAETKE